MFKNSGSVHDMAFYCLDAFLLQYSKTITISYENLLEIWKWQNKITFPRRFAALM
jgi:hypothetical protein